MILTGEAAERFYHGREKLKDFKEAIGFTISDIQEKTGLAKSTVSLLVGKSELKPTAYNQNNLDFVIDIFHLNKNWVYGNSKKMMTDTKALTLPEICAMILDTKEKRKTCAQRFDESRIDDKVSLEELAGFVGVTETTVSQWINGASKRPKYIEMVLRYCKKYKVNPGLLFYGKRSQSLNKLLASNGDLFDESKNQKRWYIVNRTYLITNHGWWIIPEGFQIKQAYRKQEVSKDYPVEYVEIDGKTQMKLTTERPIASFINRGKAETALKNELARISAEGTKVWKAHWSGEHIR